MATHAQEPSPRLVEARLARFDDHSVAWCHPGRCRRRFDRARGCRGEWRRALRAYARRDQSFDAWSGWAARQLACDRCDEGAAGAPFPGRAERRDAAVTALSERRLRPSPRPRVRRTTCCLHHFEWQASNTGKGLTLRGLAQQSTVAGANPFNLNTFSIVHDSRAVRLSFLDFSLDVNGNSRDRISVDGGLHRVSGARLQHAGEKGSPRSRSIRRHDNLCCYFRRAPGTRHIAGFTVRRQERPSLAMQTTAGWVKSPAAVFRTAAGTSDQRLSNRWVSITRRTDAGRLEQPRARAPTAR